jgi:hypothetical protein
MLGVQRQGKRDESEDEDERWAMAHWREVCCRRYMSFAQGDNFLAGHNTALVVEDLGQKLVLDVVELLEGGLQGGLVFAGSLVKVFAEAVCGVMHQQLGVLEALGVVGEAEMDELGVVLHLLEGGAGLVDVSVEHLLAGDLGHGVNEFRVQEALFTRLGFLGLKFEAGEGLGVGKIFVARECVEGRAEGEKQRQGKKKSRGPES